MTWQICARMHPYEGGDEPEECPVCGLVGHFNKPDAEDEAADIFEE